MKIKKNIYLAHFGSFLSITVKKNFSRKSASVTLFLFLGFYGCEEFQNKTTEKIQKKS